MTARGHEQRGRGRAAAGRARRAVVALAGAGLLVLGCGGAAVDDHGDERPLAFLHAEAAPGASERPGDDAAATLVPPEAGETESVPVELPGESFRVATRNREWVPRLVQAPCSQCHSAGGMGVPASAGAAARQVHSQISRPHGAAPLVCATCHSPDDPARLQPPGGVVDGEHGAIELTHAYRLCGTCHFEQLRDWAGGAHGKRLGGWAGERVAAPCSACHDPHDPAIPRRRPATFSPPPEERTR